MSDVENTIKNLKKIIDLDRTDNIDDQKKIAQSLIEHRFKKTKGKDLTLKERAVLFEILTTGHSVKLEILEEDVERLKRKLKQYLIDNLLILIVNVALAITLIIMTIGK